MKNILFIEDEAVMQKTVSEFLGAKGYNVVSALDGELGINMAKNSLPDLILLDIVLPKKSGFDVLRDLKNDEKTKSVPVIVLTNLSQMDDVSKMMDMGITTYLVKSDQSLQDILRVIDQTLGVSHGKAAGQDD
ncbi:MAG TPA: response regulator [Candidatus Pacearchaeota archaeon]|nr:response regulator [Candidatus Pacearchaeota archaeon]